MASVVSVVPQSLPPTSAVLHQRLCVSAVGRVCLPVFSAPHELVALASAVRKKLASLALADGPLL